MFFPASKLVFFLFTPSNFLILCVLAGAALFGLGWRGTGGFLVVFAGIGLALGGLSPLPALAMLPLEERFPRFEDDGQPVTGIILLGGGIETRIATARGQFVGNDADERQTYAAALARRYPQARLVFSGGSGSLRGGGDSEADIISRYADTLGLPRSRLILEGRSRNTHENARFSAELVQPKPEERWLLVTSGWHMPRAVGCFRQAGFRVTAFPVDYRTGGWGDLFRYNGFASDGLFQLDLAVKEWIGLAVYRFAGYTSGWLPGPEDAAPTPATADPSR